jgi:hypothetical protein
VQDNAADYWRAGSRIFGTEAQGLLRRFGFAGQSSMRSTLCAALAFGIATSSAKAQGDSARVLWVEAVSIMQGTDTVDFFSPRTVMLVAGALRDIRQQYPDMKAIHQPGWRNLILSVQDSVGVATLTGASGDSIVRTGLRELDSLNEQLGVENVKVGSVAGTPCSRTSRMRLLSLARMATVSN